MDANVLFSAAYRESVGIQQLWQIADTNLVSSAYAINEARRNLSTLAQLSRLDKLLAAVQIVREPVPGAALPADVALPDKDAPILLAAIGALATHLITGDKRHFGSLFGQTVAGVLIQPPADFLQSRQTS